jgi:DNA repair protein RecO (recombination protein O)
LTQGEVQTEGIVLRARTYGENDLLVDFLTPREGRLSGMARHGRKSRKRFGTVLESLNIVHLRYRDRGTFVSLEEAVLETPLNRLASNLSRLVAAFYLLDLVRQSIHERNPDPRLYSLLKSSLVALNGEDLLPDILQNFEYSLLNLLGYTPSLKDCLSCGRGWDEKGKFYFVFREGGIYCADCLPRGEPYERFSQESLHKILPRFIEYQLGHPLKSRQILMNIAGAFFKEPTDRPAGCKDVRQSF